MPNTAASNWLTIDTHKVTKALSAFPLKSQSRVLAGCLNMILGGVDGVCPSPQIHRHPNGTVKEIKFNLHSRYPRDVVMAYEQHVADRLGKLLKMRAEYARGRAGHLRALSVPEGA